MPQGNDFDAGLHKARRRFYLFENPETGIVNESIAAGSFEDSNPLAAVGYENFNGQFVATTVASTTIEVRVIPRANYAGGGLFSDDEFTVALIAAPAAPGPQRYSFCWGVGRGLIMSALGTGGTFVYSAVFKIRIRNTGANIASLVSLEGITMV